MPDRVGVSGQGPSSRRRIVAVTGAAGMIGRVVRARLADRYELRPLTHRPADFASRIIEVADLDSVVDAIRGSDVVLHLASTGHPISSWARVLESDIIGVHNILEGATIAGVPKVVFASSNHVVGGYEMDEAPALYRAESSREISEGSEIRADSLYGAAKAFGEILGRHYAEQRGLSVICVRIGTVRPDDDPCSEGIASTAAWMNLSAEERYERMRSTWLSQRDCANLLAAAIDTDIRWGLVYGVSNNRRRFWSLEGARRLLGFAPLDQAPEDCGGPGEGGLGTMIESDVGGGDARPSSLLPEGVTAEGPTHG